MKERSKANALIESDERDDAPPPSVLEDVRYHLKRCPTCNRPMVALSKIPTETIENVARLLGAYSDLPSQVAAGKLLDYVKHRQDGRIDHVSADGKTVHDIKVSPKKRTNKEVDAEHAAIARAAKRAGRRHA